MSIASGTCQILFRVMVHDLAGRVQVLARVLQAPVRLSSWIALNWNDTVISCWDGRRPSIAPAAGPNGSAAFPAGVLERKLNDQPLARGDRHWHVPKNMRPY